MYSIKTILHLTQSHVKNIITFSFMLLSIISYGQQISTSDNIVNFGINRAFYGHGDIFGSVIYGEYSRSLNSNIDLTSRIMGGYAYNESLYNSNQTSLSLGATLSLTLTPFPKSFQWLKFNIGAFYHRFASKYNNNTNYEIDNSFGVVGSIRFNIFDTFKYQIGIRSDMFVNIGGECLTCQMGAFGGLKF